MSNTSKLRNDLMLDNQLFKIKNNPSFIHLLVMKTSFFATILLCSIAIPTLAQTDKGQWQVGAQLSDLSYRSFNMSRYTTLSAKLAPSIGYFIKNNLLIGIGVPLSVNSSHTLALLDETQVGIGLAPFVQYYFGASKLKPYLGVSYNYNYDKYSYKSPNASTVFRRNGYSDVFIPTVGLAYFLNERVALNTILTYSFRSSTMRGPDVVTPQVTLVSADSETQFLSLGFGVQFFLGR